MGENRHTGSSLDGFLEEQGLLAEASIEAVKRVLAWSVARAMAEQGLSQSEMARRMGTSRAALARLLDPDNGSLTLNTAIKAAQALGKRWRIQLVG